MSLEPEELDHAIVPSEADKEVRPNEVAAKEVLKDKGLKAGMHEAVEVDDEDEEVGEAHPCTPIIIINNPLSASFFEVGHILPSPTVSTSSSSRHYT